MNLALRFKGRVRCTWCRGTNLELSSFFGGTVSELLFECKDCHLPVGLMKWEMLEGSAADTPPSSQHETTSCLPTSTH